MSSTSTNNSQTVTADPSVSPATGPSFLDGTNADLRYPLRKGVRLALLGDSFASNCSPAPNATSWCGMATALEAVSLGQFRYDQSLNKGISGQTTTQIAARMQADIVPLASQFDVLWVDAGRNDANADQPWATGANAQSTWLNIKAMVDLGLSLGKFVFLGLPFTPQGSTPYNLDTATKRSLADYVNRQAREYARAIPNVYLVDPWRNWADPTQTDGRAASGVLKDAVHPGNNAAYMVAKQIIADVGPMFPKAIAGQWQWDAYDAVLNPYGNILAGVSASIGGLKGAGGSLTNFTGTAADGIGVQRFTGTDTPVAAKVAGAAGFGVNGGDGQSLTFTTLASGGGTGAIRIPSFSTALATPAGVIGKYVEASMLVQFASIANMSSCSLTFTSTDGTTQTVMNAMAVDGTVGPWTDGLYLYRTTKFLVPPANGSPSFKLDLGYNFATGGAGVITIYSPSLRVVD